MPIDEGHQDEFRTAPTLPLTRVTIEKSRFVFSEQPKMSYRQIFRTR